MIVTKEWKKQKGDTTAPVKSRNSDTMFSHNPCGGCNACHKFTRIHSVTGGLTFGGSGDGGQGLNLQKPCATNFFQRNLGNSYMQSISSSLQTPKKAAPISGMPTIQRKCSCGGSCSSCAGEEELQGIQTKLTIGSPNDVYEQEANKVADQVMRMPESPGAVAGKTDKSVQAKPIGEEITPLVQRQIEEEEEEEPIQAKQAVGQPLQVDSKLKGLVNAQRSNGRLLNPSTRAFMEPRFGVDFGHIRLHTNQQAHETASQIKAKAFTCGNNIWLGKGESEQNKNLMAHELTHVVQQRSRRLERSPSSRQRDSLIGNAIAPLSFRSPIVQRLTNPLSDMSTFQAPVGTSGWRGAMWGCYRTNCTRKHKGWDIHASAGTECKAAVAGTTVHLSEGSSGYGDYVVLTSTADPTKKYYYTHLSARETAGTVTEGAKIGKTGVTGNASSDRPHLHFTVKESGSKVDPDGKGFTKPSKVIEATGSTATNINFTDTEPCSPPCAM